MTKKTDRKAMLIVLDGWGVRRSMKHNAVKLGKTPNFDRYWYDNPHTTLYAAEQHVGLPKGFIGNSEVGHTHLGAGRLIPQELLKINQAIKDRSFFRNKVLVNAMKNASTNDRALHLLGLLSDGGVHSHINHLFALLDMAKQHKVQKVYVHCFLDGRDKPPQSAPKYIRMLQRKMKRINLGSIATMMGRFYAMDRDNRWNREHKAYDAMANHRGRVYETAMEAIKDAYSRGETDEFVKPSIILSTRLKRKRYVQKHDSVIFYNFREDRAREITRAFVQGKFQKFKRKRLLDLHFVCLTQYDKGIKAPVALPPEVPQHVLGEVVWKKKLRQLRIAETEKYAHVTYFFNGGKEGPFAREERVVIPSPKVTTYDKTPAMSAPKIAKEACRRLRSGKYSLVILNFANADMVGHTGDLSATIKAINTVDVCLGQVVGCARDAGYDVIVTADHGNAEEMKGKYQTSHTMNKVPFIVLSDRKYRCKCGKLDSIAQISPTLLHIMGIAAPRVYEKSLVE
ncbi:2,3-bisphosphoglycerate-independent phosphoglycerate mutase [Candidatus Woesearchaeota archaeon]|nr:2,3-bisphosphoglycerate-independent phosphoglycerate mutase [Candidatus Woesearchaeota archaeon]